MLDIKQDCDIAGCTQPRHKRSSYCFAHIRSEQPACKVCGKTQIHGRGLCNRCYKRWWKKQNDPLERHYTGNPETRDDFLALISGITARLIATAPRYRHYIDTGDFRAPDSVEAHALMSLIRASLAPRLTRYILRNVNLELPGDTQLPITLLVPLDTE